MKLMPLASEGSTAGLVTDICWRDSCLCELVRLTGKGVGWPSLTRPRGDRSCVLCGFGWLRGDGSTLWW